MRKIRLFTAVMLSKELCLDLERQQSNLSNEWKRQPSDNFHMTVHFIGDVPEERITEVVEILHSCEGSMGPQQLAIDHQIILKPKNQTILAAGVSGDITQLKGLRTSLGAQMLAANMPWAAGEWRPHITLARASQSVNLVTEGQSFEAIPWHVTQLSLVESEITHSGAHYRVLHTITL